MTKSEMDQGWIEEIERQRDEAIERLVRARRERDEAIQHIRDLAARVDGDGGQRQDADGSLAETVRRVDAAIVRLQRERSAAEHRQVMSRLDELCAEIQLSGESRAAVLEAARADRAERERDEAIARAERAEQRRPLRVTRPQYDGAGLPPADDVLDE